jgi:hypothetical protein
MDHPFASGHPGQACKFRFEPPRVLLFLFSVNPGKWQVSCLLPSFGVQFHHCHSFSVASATISSTSGVGKDCYSCGTRASAGFTCRL